MIHCPSCRQDRLPADFHRESARKNGLSGYCKECGRAYDRKRVEQYATERGPIPDAKDCTKCNERKPITQFYASKKSKDGFGNHCIGCWNSLDKIRMQDPHFREQARLRCAKHNEKFRDKRNAYSKTPNARFGAYRNDARQRNGIEFAITKDEFMLFWQKPCFYCGDIVATIGLDRVDNSRGYVLGNVVSCCKTCNFSKHALGRDEFIAHCEKVAAKAARKKESKEESGCLL